MDSLTNAKHLRLAKRINKLSNRDPLLELMSGQPKAGQLSTSLQGYMEEFYDLRDHSTIDQMKCLYRQYPGLNRFAKLMESFEQGVRIGAIEVTKNN